MKAKATKHVPTETYTCSRCKETFTKITPEEEARAECRGIFGDIPKEEMAIVCHDCWTYMMERTVFV